MCTLEEGGFIEKLLVVCKELNLIVQLTSHDGSESEILPYRIEDIKFKVQKESG